MKGILLSALCCLAAFAPTSSLKLGEFSRTTSPLAPTSPFAQGDSKEILGKLCQATEAVDIHAKPDPKSKVCYEAKAFDYMVFRPFNETWSKILLQNGTYGFVLRDHVALLPYRVTKGATGGTGLTNEQIVESAADRSLKMIGDPVTHALRGGGFVSEAFSEIGMKLPSSVAKQSRLGSPVSRLQDLRPGDRLYFWDAQRDRMGFSGIYLGGGYFIGPLPGRKSIATDYLGSKKWLKALVAARR
ncbi:MAG TPA: NlpC/P60 family protein [Fimbriimonadaceae bacterium]|nr:NlpC/P60 family protein [Fimbriimonadaceae bacterium]